MDGERISKEDDAVSCLGNTYAWGWRVNYICRDFDLGNVKPRHSNAGGSGDVGRCLGERDE